MTVCAVFRTFDFLTCRCCKCAFHSIAHRLHIHLLPQLQYCMSEVVRSSMRRGNDSGPGHVATVAIVEVADGVVLGEEREPILAFRRYHGNTLHDGQIYRIHPSHKIHSYQFLQNFTKKFINFPSSVNLLTFWKAYTLRFPSQSR